MKNAEELRDQLSAVFQELKAGTLEHKTVDSLANLAGKMIASAKIQQDYQARTRTKEDMKIKFLDCE